MSSFVPANIQAGNQTFRLATRFALRELRGGLRGFYIFIACIALGVAAIAGVTSLSRALTEGIANEGQSILGGDLSFSLIHRQAGDEEVAFLETLGSVSRVATLRAMEGEIYELYLKPEYQGLGFGRTLFTSVRDTLSARKLRGLAVQVLSDNQPARNFYRALGGRLTAKSWYRLGGRRM